jgi:hypothetical protein
MNVGIAWLARATGAPILAVGIAVDRAWRLRSWDRFTIPKPFARLRVDYADPVQVPTDASDADLEALAANLREQLRNSESVAFHALGVADDLDGDGPQRHESGAKSSPPTTRPSPHTDAGQGSN